jgi:lipopolysaccharide export system ATP-binding protein
VTATAVLDEVWRTFGGTTAVRQTSVELRPGIVGLLGPNGAGKTTTFYMVVGLTRPDSGTVFLDKDDITGLPMYMRARQGIGYLPQEASVFRKLSAEQNVLAVLESHGMPTGERHTRTRELLDELGITHIARQPAYTLSGGERRRLEICRALATSPQFILLDEPFAGIDPIAVIDIQAIIGHLKGRGIGVLITDHNVRETLRIVDRAYLLEQGKVLFEGTSEALIRDEQARKFYLGENFNL